MPDNRYYYFKDAKGNRHTVNKAAFDNDREGFAKAFPGARMEVIDRKTGRRGDVDVKDAGRVGDFGAHLFTGQTVRREKYQPKTSLGKAALRVAQKKWGKEESGAEPGYASLGLTKPLGNGDKESALVKGLREADALKRRDEEQMPIDYTKPSAVKQMVGRTHREQQTLDRRIEQAGREAGKDVQGEIRRRNAPAFDLGNEDVNNNLVKTRGQLEKEMEKSGSKFVDDEFSKYIGDVFKKEDEAAFERGQNAALNVIASSPSNAVFNTTRARNEEMSPEKRLSNITNEIESNIHNLFSSPKTAERINAEAARLGVSPDEYIEHTLVPSLMNKVSSDFDKTELKSLLPSGAIETILMHTQNSMTGALASMGLMTKSQRQYGQRALAETLEGNNPKYNPGLGTRVAGSTLSFMMDMTPIGMAEKPAAAVAGKLFGNGVAQAARIANSTLGGRIARMAGSGMVSQGITGVLYGSTNAAVQNYSTGDDTSIGNTVKVMAMGGLSEGASWATMGGIGGVVGAGIYNVSGVKRIPAKAFQLAMEGIGMHMGGNVAKTIEGHDTDWTSIEGNLEACANVVALKLTHARLPKRQSKDGVKESYLDMVARNINGLMTSDGQRAAFGGYTFTNEEKEQLFGSASAPKRTEALYGYDVHDNPLTRKESLTSWAMRAKKTAAKGKGEESYKDTDAEFVKTAYDEIMADNTIPWDTKAKFSALVMGTVPSARPMMENCRIEGGSVNEYSKNGELLSKNSFKSIDERNSIIYSLNMKREDQRLSNAYGAAQIKDEKTAQATLEAVAEANGMTAEQLKAAMGKQPLRRSEEEQNACVALRKAYEDEQFVPGTLHAEQSNTEGKDVVEENGLGTETPNNEAASEVLGDLTKTEDALQAAMDSNDVLKEEYERMQKAGMSNPQIYMELFNSGLTQEQLAPLADYINALSKTQGMFKGTQDKIVETTQKHVGQWSYKGELNGEKQNGEQMVFVKDDKGRVLIVGAGDVAFDGEGRVRDGDMLTVYDPATREMDFVHAKDVTLEHTATSEEYAKDYQRQLEELNSTVYAEAQQRQSEEANGSKPDYASLSPTKPLGEEGNEASLGLSKPTKPLGEKEVAPLGEEPVATFADGTPVPMMKDSKGRETADYSQMSPEQGAEWIEKTFGEDAEAVADGKIERANKALSKAEKMKIDMTADDADVLEAKAKKKAAIEAAQKELELYTNIKKAMVEKKVKATMEKENTVGEVDSASRVSDAVREKFEKSKKIPGRRGSITLPDGTKITGQYFYGEVSGLTPSHDPFNDFKQNEGFPVNEDGSSSNSRSYKDKESRLFTEKIGRDFGGQALKNVPVVQDGILLSGNGTTMGKQLAERYGTDGKYYESLSENAEGFGWTPKQIEEAGFKGTVYFVPDKKMPLTSKTFDLFNKQETKSIGNTEQSVKNAKVLDTDEISAIVSEIEGSGSLDAFFNNPSAINSLLTRLVDKGVIGLNEVAGLREGEDKLSAAGKDFVKNLLLGSVFSENTIRMMGADAMLKTKALNGIRAVTDNMKLGDYALMKEIDKAVQLLYEARQGGSGVDAYLRTPAMFGENAADRYDPISQAIALALEGKVEDFRELMMAYNRNAAPYADANQTEMFGERPTKEEFIKEFLKLRNWEDYETRHSSKEGNGDAGSSEGTEPQAPGGKEPTEEQREVDEAVKNIATEITKKTGIEVVTDEKTAEEVIRESEETDSDLKYHKETDEATLEELENGETVKVYRAMQVIDGKLYPPMAAAVNGKRVEANELGTWIRADENPDLAIPDIDPKTKEQKVDKKTGELKWKFKLDKGGKDATGKKATDIPAAYNPYWHTSRSPLNDQFKSAWIRPNIVVVECEVPVSELSSGYKAERAKDAVGEVDWKSGVVSGEVYKQTGRARKVILSRWCKPVRVLSDAEVAQRAKEFVGDAKVEIPENVLTPRQRIEFEKAGFKIGAPEKGVKKSDQINEALKRGLQIDNSVKEFRTKDGEVYGFTDGEKIYLDTRKMKSETPLHEYTHLWCDMLRKVNPKEWENVKKLFDKVEGLKEKVQKLYPELEGDALYEEMITTYSGREGTKKLEDVVRKLAAEEGKSVTESAKAKGFLEKVKEALTKYWKGVADVLGIHFTTAEEVADKVLADWAKGYNPKDKIKDERLPITEEEWLEQAHYDIDGDRPADKDIAAMIKTTNRLLKASEGRTDIRKNETTNSIEESIEIDAEYLFPNERDWFSPKKYEDYASFVDDETKAVYDLIAHKDAQGHLKSVTFKKETFAGKEPVDDKPLSEEPLSILPKKEENTLNPIVKAAENYKKDHPLTEGEIRSSDVDDIAKDMAVDYLNGEVTDDLHRAVYESIYEKVKDAKMKNATKQADNKTEITETPKVEASASPIEGMKNAAEKFAKEKEAAAEAMGEVNKPQQKADDAAVEASNKKVNDLWNDLLKAGREDLSASFIGLNARQLEVLPKLVSAMAENAYLRIKRGMHNLEDVVKEMRKEFAPAAQVFKKEDVDAIYEQMMNIRYRDGEQRMSLKEWADYYEKISPKHKEELVGDSKEAEERKIREKKFIDKVNLRLGFGQKINGIVELRKMAEECGLKDVKDTDLQELAETAIVRRARGIASSESYNDARKFELIKKLYENQPSLNQRDSERVMKQQYSTPAPYAFLADMYVKAGIEVKSALEPSAGNGMLTIGLPKDAVHVNDIDAQRLANLQRQGFKNVTSQDGTQPFADKDVDVVVTNPPFGSATPRDYDGYIISSLEGQMAINALESMKDNGRAAIIIGGKTEYAKNGSLNPKDKALLGYLYSHYNVEDVINVDGSLYAKQGTSYPTRIILINGRRFDENAYPPVKGKARAEAVKSYDELYKRINDDILRSGRMDSPVGEGGEDANAKPHKPSVANTNEEGVRAGGNGGGEQKPSVRTGGVHDKTAEPVSDNVLGTEGGTKPGENGGLPDGATGADGAGTEPTSSKEPTTGTNKQRGDEPGGNGRPNTQPNADETTDVGNGGRPRGQLERVDRPVRGLSAEKVTYAPRSENPFTLKAVMPADQQEAVNKNLEKLGDADQFLVEELGYNDKADLYAHLAAEQVDSVALALQQAKKGNAFIIGDMTGIGKGRQAASLIRYAKKQGQVPVYFTKTAGLLSDVYRDLVDIGSKELRPFVFGSAKEAAITDADGNVVFALPSKNEVKRVLDYIEENGELPKEYDYVLTTYSQVSNGVYEFDENGNRKERKLAKGKKFGAAAISGQARRDAIEKLMKNGYLILDESHTAGGDSGQGNYFQHIIQKAKNVTFFSATFAKRPDNMPIYALRTAMNQGGLKASDLIDAVKRGGATLQEIMSKALTQSGQMIRRERDMTGVTIDWKAIDDPEVVAEQREQYDSIIGLFNDIINFQRTYVSSYVDRRNEELAKVQSSMGIKRGTEALGIKNQPFASKAFNTVQQVLLSLKAKSAAERAVEYLKQGMKPVIALNNTNESQTGNLALGEEMDAPDLGTSLKKGLEGTLRFTSKNAKDESESGYINLKDLGADAVEAYHALEEKIRKTSTGLSLSPIDVIKNELTKAGYKVGELTGRQTEFAYNENGTVTKVKRADTDKKKLAREFNDGQIDALILNKSAATGISLHASSKYADQRKRVMIVAQQQLDVNDEVQMRGRIDRTGQVARGAYEYVVSLIPAEQRLLMMFKAKLKSLDANTTSSQKSKFNEMEVADITNKYGDKVVKEYMAEHLDLYARMADPFGWEKIYGEDISAVDTQRLVSSLDGMGSEPGGDASKLLGRMALLKVKEQEKMLQEIGDLYAAEIQRLNEMGENDLEITELPLKAKTINKGVWKEGTEPGGDNAFADNTYVEKVNMAVLKKPMKAEEVKKAQDGLTGGKSWDEYRKEKITAAKEYFDKKIAEATQKYEERAVKAATKAKEKYIKDAKKAQKENGMSDEQIEKMAGYQYESIYSDERTKLDEVVKNLKSKYGVFERALETFNTEDAFVLPTDMNNPAELSGFGNSYGRLIDIKITDNFSPNASTISFATLDGRRKITFPINGKAGLGSDKADVIGIIDRLTRQASAMGDNHLRVLSMDASNWDKLTSNESRKDGYIITGNLLQALIDTKEQGLGGQLVKYTTDTGEVKTGILMPEKFEPNGLANEKPINSVAEKFELPSNKGGITEITSSDGDVKIAQGFDYIKMTRNYTIRVPKSNKKGGKYFLDKELLKMVDGGNFETRGNTMLAEVKEEKLKDVLDRLSELGVKVKEESKVHYRMELGNTFSDSKEHFDAVRDRAVEEKGIVMPNLNKEKVKVVEVEKHGFGSKERETLNNAKAWAISNLVTTGKQELPTMRDGTTYTISKKAIDKYLSESAVKKSENLDTHLSVLSKLKDVIHESIEAEIHPDYKKGEDGLRSVENGYGEGVLVHRLYGAVELDGKTYRVKTTMQEFRGGEENKPHSYEVTKIELLDSPGKRENPDRPPSDASNNSIDNKIELPDTPGTAVLPDSSPLDMTPSNSIDTAKLLQGVGKSYDSGKKLLDESKDLTDGETFFRKESDKPKSGNKPYEASLSLSKPLGIGGGSKPLEDRIAETVEKVSKQTGGKVKMVNAVEEIGNEQVRRDIESGKKVTGWYDENTGEVHLYMPNIHDAYTAEKTVWHETVGHKGMRGLLGEKFNDYMRGLWMDLDNPINAELRAYVKERMKKDSMGFYDAIEEFIAESAEKGKGEPGFWNNIKNKVTDALHEIGYRISPNVKDVKYMLWLAKNVQKKGNDPWWKMRADAVKWKIEHENVEYTKIHGGEFYENDGKNHDFEDMSREEWDEATDGQIHYRTAPSAATALDRYHKMLDTHGYMATEAFMDNMLSLEKLMKAVDPSIKKIEDVKSSMNPYVLQNTMQGAMSDKMTLFEHQVMKPLDKAMSDVLDSFAGKNTEEKIRECNLYMIGKHGLERNRVLFVRDKIREKRKVKSEESDSIDALEAAWNGEKNDLGQKLRSGQIDLREYYRQMDEWIVQNIDKDFKAEEHDYSGMHGLQEIDDLKSPYDDAGAIDSVMSQEAKMENQKKGSVDNLWKRIKDATNYSINSDYENGLMSEELRDRVRDMFDWYVPLRKYDEATAEDIYGYISGEDGKGFIGETLMNAKGRKSLSDVNVLAQIGAMGNRAIRNGGQNAVKQAFARFVRNSGEQNLVKETKVWVEKKGTDMNGNDIWEEAYPQIPDNANAHDVATIVDAFETDMKTKQAKGEAKTLSNSTDIGFKFARAKNKSEHFVDVKIAGRTHRFVVLGNPRAAQALNGMLENSSPNSYAMKKLKAATRFMAQMATSYAPEFVMRNIIRDAEMASSNVTAKEGVRYGLKWARYYAELNPVNVFYNEGAGALKSLKWKDLKEGVGIGLYARYREGTLGNSKMERYFKEFMQNGGETGWVQVKTMQEWEKEYKRDVSRERSNVAKAGKMLRNFLVGNVENLNEVAENMARFATFCTSRDFGRSAVRSAYDAKQVSTNFNRHGSGDAIKTFKNGEMGTIKEMRRNVYGTIASYLRNYSMFFNAGVQSTHLLMNNVKKAPVGTVASMMAMPFGLGIMAAVVNNAMIASEDEKKRKGVKDPYGELPEYIRRNNLCIYKGGGEFVTIPLAIELRAFYGLGDIAAGMTAAKNVKSTRNAAMDAVGCMSQLLPVVDFMNSATFDKEPRKELLKGVSPTAFAPFVEWWLNSDWKGTPIRREGDYTKNRPAWMNAYSGTPEKLMDLNKWVNAETNDVAPGNENMRGNSLLDEATDPAMLNHIIGTIGGGAATFVTRGTGLALKYADGREQEIETKDIPFLRSLMYTPSEQTSMARTKAKWYSYKESMEKNMSNYSMLKNKNVPLTERIRNAADRHRFEQGADYARIRIIKDTEKQMKRWNKMKRLNADDKKQVDFANKNIEMIMQKAVEQMDGISDD